MDINGEWIWSGNYEMTLSRKWTPSQYSFYATLFRKRSKNGNTTGWYVNLYLSIFYSNGRDIRILKNKCFRTLKAARLGILEKIKEIHNDNEGTTKLINEWKENRAKPVFGLDRATGELVLIGSTYFSASQEMRREKEDLWFNDDLPNYDEHQVLYELEIYGFDKPMFYLSKTEKNEFFWIL